MDAVGATSNALHMAAMDVAHDERGRPLSTAVLNEMAALIVAQLGEQGYVIVPKPPLPIAASSESMCGWHGITHHRETDSRDPDGCGWRTLHKFQPVTW